jgi:hypothetical protein
LGTPSSFVAFDPMMTAFQVIDRLDRDAKEYRRNDFRIDVEDVGAKKR